MSGSYFFFFGLYGLVVPFLSPALIDLGYTKQQVGFIISGTFLCQLLVPTLGGRLSDKYLSADRTILYGSWLMFASTLGLVFYASKSILFVTLLMLFSIARAPMISLQDTLAMQIANDHPGLYSRMRVMGSVGFTVFAIVFGYIIDLKGIGWFFPSVLVVVLAFCIQSFFLPKEEKQVADEDQPGFWKRLDRTWWFWLGSMVVGWICFGPFNYGFTLYLEEQGIPNHLTGWIWGIGVFAEIIVFLTSSWFFNRWRIQTCLMIGFGANLIRWFVMGVWPNPWVISAIQLLHGLGFGLFYAAAMKAIGNYSGGVERASYQGVFSTFVGGLASVVGTALAGMMHQQMAFRDLILWFVPLQIVAMIMLHLNPLRHGENR